MMNTTENGFLFLCIALFMIGSCARLESTQEEKSSLKEEDRYQHYQQDKYRSFNTVMRVLKNQGYNLETRDSNEGLIFTDYQLSSTVGAPFDGNPKVRVEAVLKQRDQGTQVVLTLRVQQEITLTGNQSNGVTQQEAKRYYKDLFRMISEQIKQ